MGGSDNKMKEGEKAYVVSGFEFKEGIFVSRGPQWNYIRFEDGLVVGYSDETVYADKVEVLEYLVGRLKKDILLKLDQFIRTMPELAIKAAGKKG